MLEFGFQLDFIVYTFRTVDQMHTQFQLVKTCLVANLPERNNCVSWGMSVHALNRAATVNDHIKQTVFT